MKKPKDSIDIGTKELGRHYKIVPKITRGLYGLNGKVMDETEIDRLLLNDTITTTQHATLEMFFARLHKVGFVGLKSPSYDSPIHADASAVGDKKAHTIRGVVKLIDMLDNSVGRDVRVKLVRLVCEDRVWGDNNDGLSEAIVELDKIMGGRR